jgi:peptide/nickel transport system substrate-binding protein
MRVTYPIRQGVTWQDGAPFTAQDLVFSTRFLQDRGIPSQTNTVARQIASAEAPDDHTFVATYRSAYYQAVSHAILAFWPVPQHIVAPAYERFLVSGNPEELINHPYWTSEYVHLGPFRLASWDPSRELTFQSFPGYFRGPPKVDRVRVQIHLGINGLFADLLAGTNDVFFENTLDLERSAHLERSPGGEWSLFLKPSNIRILVPQYRPAYQSEPANLDPRVRAALYHALDREELAEGLQLGHRETAAWGHLLPSDPLFEAG